MSQSKKKTFQKVSLRYMNDDVIKMMNDNTNECLLSYQGIHFAHTQHSQMTGSEWKLRIWGSILLHYAADGVQAKPGRGSPRGNTHTHRHPHRMGKGRGKKQHCPYPMLFLSLSLIEHSLGLCLGQSIRQGSKTLFMSCHWSPVVLIG